MILPTDLKRSCSYTGSFPSYSNCWIELQDCIAHILLQNAFPWGTTFILASLDVRLCIDSANMWFLLMMRARIEQNVTQMKNWAQISSFSAQFAVIKGLYWNFHRQNTILLVVHCWNYIFFSIETLFCQKLSPYPSFLYVLKIFRWDAQVELIFCSFFGSQVRKSHQFLFSHAFPWG